MREGELPDIGRPLRDLGGEISGLLRQGRVGGVEIDVDEAAELLDAHRVEANRRGIEVRERLRMGRAPEPAGEVVGPGVIGAHDARRAPLAREELVCPVLAHVVERPQRPLPVADDADGPPGHLGRHIGARLAQLLGVADPLPAARKDRLLLEAEPFRARIRLRPQREGPRRVRVVPAANMLEIGPGGHRGHRLAPSHSRFSGGKRVLTAASVQSM